MSINLPCTVCEAPVPVWLFKDHLKSCITIHVGLARANAPLVPALEGDMLVAYCHRVHCEDQAATHLRVSTTQIGPPQGRSVEQQALIDAAIAEARGRWATWNERNAGEATLPEGKTRCVMCNGLTKMYPNCSGCNGTGFIR